MKVSQAELARIFGVDTRTIQRWTDAGLPRQGAGKATKYDVAAALTWWLERERGRLERRRPGRTAQALAEARARIAEIRAEREALELALRKGELLPVDVVEQRFAAFAEEVRDALRAAAARWAPYLCHERTVAEAQAELQRLIHDLLTELADGRRDAAE